MDPCFGFGGLGLWDSGVWGEFGGVVGSFMMFCLFRANIIFSYIH